jgi:hypothetical protein
MASHLKLLREPNDADLLTAKRQTAQGECPHSLVNARGGTEQHIK